MKRRLLPVFVAIIVVVWLVPGSSAQSSTVAFPLGLMGPSVDDVPPSLGTLSEKLSDVAAGGFNVVYEFRAIQETAGAQEYLYLANQRGLEVIQNLPRCRAYEHDHPHCQQNPVPLWTEAEWAVFISTVATYDNLVAWFLPDEIQDMEAAAYLYDLVHTYDPLDRPVYANPGTLEQESINQFPAFTDFLWIACYPEFYGQPRPIVTYCMHLDAAATQGTDTKYGAILQFFDNVEYGGSPGHPSARELRADSYQAIIGGAKGLWYFNYEMGRDLDEVWDEVSNIADEIIGSGGLDEVILSPDVPQGIMKRIISGPFYAPPVAYHDYSSIQTLQKWQEGEGTYLFAVNIATDTVEVAFSNLWAETDHVEVLFEGRSIPITDDSITDTFAPDDVHIYFYSASQPAPPLPRVYLPFVLKGTR
jgi:hypothetical protein